MILDQLKSAVEFANNLPRYREIIGILWKYGFADVLKLVALQRVLGIEDATITLREDGVLSKPLPVRMRMALEELGPTFIKFGQIISSRRDLVDDEYFVELTKLQSQVPPFATSTAREIIESELNISIDDVFSSFQDKPVGSASIAQVHAGTLKENGAKVAIKVQRPDIQKVVELDLSILHDIARFVDKHVPEISGLNPVGVVDEFASTLVKELDFSHEASNAERFAKQFADDPTICVPKIYRDLTSTRVLTMDFLAGVNVYDEKRLQKNDIDPSVLARNITELIYKQIFEFGFFHGDPHPGNMLVMKDGAIGLLDYGMMGSFTPPFRTSIAQLIAGLAEKNHQQVMRSILDMSEEGFASNTAKMLNDVEEFSGTHLNRPLREIRLEVVLNKLLEMLRNNHLRMKGSFYLGIKALTQVEAVGRTLDPDLNFIKQGEPYAIKLMQGKYHPHRLMMLLQRWASEGLDFLDTFPGDFRNLYQQIKHGKVSIPLQHKIDPEGFEPLRKTLDSIANRLTNAILAASVLICSSILIHSGIPPKIGDVPVIGLAGLIWGFFMCLRMVLSIWKHGGL